MKKEIRRKIDQKKTIKQIIKKNNMKIKKLFDQIRLLEKENDQLLQKEKDLNLKNEKDRWSDEADQPAYIPV